MTGLFAIPINIAFIDEIDIHIYDIYIYILIISLLNIIIRINTSFYQKGVIVLDRSIIFRFYIKYDFLEDLVSLFPIFIYVLLNSENHNVS